MAGKDELNRSERPVPWALRPSYERDLLERAFVRGLQQGMNKKKIDKRKRKNSRNDFSPSDYAAVES